jgi:hypothetical protein
MPTVPLTELSREITNLTGKPSPKNYRELWGMVVDGQLAAEKVRGRYRVDVLVAVETLGVTTEPAA